MIASFIDGRIRIRAKALKDAAVMSLVTKAVGGREGILETRANLKTGSLLVRYDPAIVSPEELLAAARLLGNGIPAVARAKERTRVFKTETLLLGAAWGITTISGMLDKRLHAVFAVIFTALAAKHAYDYRNRLC
ncbi:MAG: heavy-metal-associated domain-containing protein [Desulfovibrio sp.]|jgi:hypothetical protein|nr:heavy-metal-associated domain-containing protein [Desulfovibrio sp.]